MRIYVFVTFLWLFWLTQSLAKIKTFINYHTIRIPINTKSFNLTTDKVRCSIDHLKVSKTYEVQNYSKEAEHQLQANISYSGHYRPSCVPLQKVAIVVPYRDRLEHLQKLVVNLHPFLVHQNVAEYRIFVVEQGDTKLFNRAKLFNVGFELARKYWSDDIDCFIFHDVELIPLNYANLYLCSSQPRHMAYNIVDKSFDGIFYENIFGGIVAFSAQQMINMNGFSNLFFGWGGEDDEARMRVIRVGYSIVRLPHSISTYAKLEHLHEWDDHLDSKINSERFKLIDNTEQMAHQDGLNSLHYEVIQVKEMPLYTIVTVSL